ncbi:MAG TPA: AAA family ATPase [Acidimicrobiales bacterium]|nr:AAA family ATPase [Acidimicrobiales bacterium]
MTTEFAAVLFTDVVGSTELSQRLPVEAADEFRRGHFSILRQALAEAGGTEVKNLGDGLMVVFATASAALSCAVAMQQGVERDNRGREHAVGLRVGLSGGEVSREDDDFFGDPVVEAARLCATCAGGQVLAAEVVRMMAGRRNRHPCRDLGPLTLKGLPDPVSAVEVAWEPLSAADTGAIPLPGRLVGRPAVGLVGRAPEIQAMTDAFKRVAAGEGREVMLISGEAGLGKTTLVAEAARAAYDSGACVLFGHCEEDLATPYQLFAEAVGHWVTHAPEDQLRAHVETHGSELSRLVPALSRRIPDLPPSTATDADTERFLLFAAVVGLLSMISEQQPVVLVLDDLQWADQGSLLLLRHLAAADRTTRLLVPGTYRDTELAQAPDLRDTLGVIHRQSGVGRIELAGLDDDAVLAFLEAAAGQALDDAGVGLAHAVHRETDGNPFFVGELLRHLSETGVIFQDASGRWRAPGSAEQLALPDSVREVIGGRVVRLGRDAQQVLSMAAVIGRDFDLDVLARATRTSEDELIDILDAAAGVALVRELADTPGHYNFAHALIQHTLYEDQGATRRARAHRVVAVSLEELCGDRPDTRVGELARHWTAARPIDLAKAVGYCRQAGDAALDALAPADARRYYEQALALSRESGTADPVLDIDLAIGLGTAQRQTGDPACRDTLLDAARRAADLGDTDRLAAAALATNRGFFSNTGVTDTDKVDILELALDRLPTDHRDRALVMATLCSEIAYGTPFERRQALADEALSMAEASGDAAVYLRVLNNVTYPLMVPPLHEQSLVWTADALTRAQSLGDPVQLFFAAVWRAVAAARSADIDEVDRCLEIMGSLAARLDQPLLQWMYTYQQAWRAQIAGDADRAEQLTVEALQIGTDGGQPDAAVFFGTQLVPVNLQRGSMGDMVALLEQMVADAPDVAGTVTAALALAHAEADSIDGARRRLQELAAAGFDLPFDPLWMTGMGFYAEAAITCGEAAFAGPLFERLAPWADQWCTVGTCTAEGPVSYWLGGLATVLGRYDEADGYFSRATATSRRVGAKFFAARSQLLWGRMLLERRAPGDADRAHDLLSMARTAAAEHGYANVERRATEALQLVGR